MPTRIAYLGPAGTYGEQATRALVDLEGLSEVEFLPCVGLRAVVERLSVPGANSTAEMHVRGRGLGTEEDEGDAEGGKDLADAVAGGHGESSWWRVEARSGATA